MANMRKDVGVQIVVELTDSNLIETADDVIMLAADAGLDNVNVTRSMRYIAATCQVTMSHERQIEARA